MKKLFLVLATVLVLAAVGCAPQVDIDAERAAVLEAFVEAKQAAAAKDTESFVSFFANGASRFPPNAPRVTGNDAIREFVSEWFAAPGLAFSFPEPGSAEVSSAGDLGYTTGSYEGTVNDAEGNPVTSRGKIVVIWKKQSDGTWKVVLDIWNTDQPAGSATD
jgi:ketosteroid isomerase-like protein